MIVQGAGFITFLIASAFLDGEAWHGALIALLVSAAMMALPEIVRRARR